MPTARVGLSRLEHTSIGTISTSNTLLGILLLVQSVFLLPALNARLATIIAGGHPGVSPDHLIYMAIDGLKLGLLSTIVRMEGVRIIPLPP